MCDECSSVSATITTGSHDLNVFIASTSDCTTRLWIDDSASRVWIRSISIVMNCAGNVSMWAVGGLFNILKGVLNEYARTSASICSFYEGSQWKPCCIRLTASRSFHLTAGLRFCTCHNWALQGQCMALYAHSSFNRSSEDSLTTSFVPCPLASSVVCGV